MRFEDLSLDDTGVVELRTLPCNKLNGRNADFAGIVVCWRTRAESFGGYARGPFTFVVVVVVVVELVVIGSCVSL